MWRRAAGLGATLAVVVAGLAGCGGADPVNATMTVTPGTALADVPVRVSIKGLRPGSTVTVTSRATGSTGVRWTGRARFTVPSDGEVSLAQPSVGGSYKGVNPMGLFELMAPPASSEKVVFEPFFNLHPFTVRLSATDEGKVVATASARRTMTAGGVSSKDLRPDDGGVYGKLFLPPKPARPRPALLLFGGSEGGFRGSKANAALLAGHGYPTLALAYFKEPGLPRQLHDIALEYFVEALKILRAQPGVDQHHVSVLGLSRGSEAAQLLGADFPALVNGVVAGVPSSVVYGSLPDGTGAAWTLDGTPVPSNPPDNTIEVEKIRGPMLLVCAGKDRIWPSCTYTDKIRARLRAKHSPYPLSVLKLPDAGHFVGTMLAYFSATDGLFAADGGALSANEVGGAQAHAALRKFLAAQK